MPANSPAPSARMAPGTAVKLDVLHKGQDKTLDLTLGELPNGEAGRRMTTEGSATPAAPTCRSSA